MAISIPNNSLVIPVSGWKITRFGDDVRSVLAIVVDTKTGALRPLVSSLDGYARYADEEQTKGERWELVSPIGENIELGAK